MPTNNDVIEALRDGRWKPEVVTKQEGDNFTSSYQSKNDGLYEATSPYKDQSITDLKIKIRQGVMQGKIHP
jgi:hypothetical protein